VRLLSFFGLILRLVFVCFVVLANTVKELVQHSFLLLPVDAVQLPTVSKFVKYEVKPVVLEGHLFDWVGCWRWVDRVHAYTKGVVDHGWNEPSKQGR